LLQAVTKVTNTTANAIETLSIRPENPFSTKPQIPDAIQPRTKMRKILS